VNLVVNEQDINPGADRQRPDADAINTEAIDTEAIDTEVDPAARAKAEAEVDRRLLESSLVRLRATGHPLLRSMADDLLAGRVSMRELARDPNIAAPIQAAARRYLNWRNTKTAAELQAISDDMAARVQWMRDQVARGWAKRDGDRRGDQEDERGSRPEQ
jgi:hypothetical protein